MTGLVGGMIDRLQSSEDTAPTAFRVLVPAESVWADLVPQNVAMPYCVVSHISTALLSECKGQTSQICSVTIQVDIWDSNRAKVESVLDQVEKTFIGEPVTITGNLTTNWLSCELSNRWSEQDTGAWHGIVEFAVMVEKVRA